MVEYWAWFVVLAGIIIFYSIMINPKLKQWNERQKEKLKYDRYGNKLD